jgi:chromosome segregation ATPase
MSEEKGLRERVTRQGEEAIGKLAQELLENSVVSGALSAAFETRERALRAQEAAMGALNLPSANDLERLTRRLRGVSQRLEAIEDGLDRLEQRIEKLGAGTAIDQRLAGLEAALQRVESAVAGSAAGDTPGSGSWTADAPGSGPEDADATVVGPADTGPGDSGSTVI